MSEAEGDADGDLLAVADVEAEKEGEPDDDAARTLEHQTVDWRNGRIPATVPVQHDQC